MNLNPMKKGNKKKITVDKDTINYILSHLQDLNKKIESVNTNVVNSHDNLNEKLGSSQIISDIKTEIENFKEHIKQEIITDLQNGIKKGHYIIRENIAANTSATNELNENVSQTRKLIENTLNAQLIELNEEFQELMQKRNEIKISNEKIKSWQDAAVEFFQYIERTLEIPIESDDEDTKTNQKSISSRQVTYKKVLKDFEKYVNPLGLQRICPKSNEDVNEKLHKVEYKESKDVQTDKIIRCKKWGYAINGELYDNMRAEVVVAKSSEPNKNANQSAEFEPENSEPSGSIKDDDQDLAPNSETPDNNDAPALDSVDGTNEPTETPQNQPEIPHTPNSDPPSNSGLDKSGDNENNNLQGSSPVDTSTLE
ncbi:MAG: nucleotide exchange factor GrpE [Cyanobacteria bacterium P01_G01_bin.39]